MEEDLFVYGIDIGTCTSCCYQYQGPNLPLKQTLTELQPSCIAIGNGIYTGKRAQDYAKRKNYCLVYDIKRIIGKPVNMISEEEKRRWPYEVKSIENTTVISIPSSIPSKYHDYYPEDLYCMLVKNLIPNVDWEKHNAVAVVTVPEKFDDVQRDATARAVLRVGFKDVKLFSEPCAAALLYYRRINSVHQHGKFAVFDFGGSTLDVAVINCTQNEKHQNVFQVLATDGDPYLGGIVIDNKIVELLITKLKEAIPSYEPHKESFASLRTSAEYIKTHFRNTDMEQPCTFFDKSCHSNKTIKFTKEDFYSVVNPIIKKALEVASRVICDTDRYLLRDISFILLVGGSSQLVSLEDRLKEQFPGIHTEKLGQGCVGMGACLRACDVFVDKVESQNFNFLPKPIGIRTDDGIREVLHEGTPIGEEVKLSHLVPSTDYAESVSIEFFQGNWEEYGERSSIGKVSVAIPRPGPRNSTDITLNLRYNEDCMLCVNASINDEEVCNVLFRDRFCTLSDEQLRERYKDLYPSNLDRLIEDLNVEVEEKKRKIIELAGNHRNGDSAINRLNSFNVNGKIRNLDVLINLNRKVDDLLQSLEQ